MNLGQMTTPIHGDITTLNAIILADPRRTEVNLGFQLRRLSQGYKILVLNSVPTPDDFEFGGTTLRSGGREGLPARSAAADRARPRVHDGIERSRGKEGYRDLQRSALANIQIKGPSRLVKILPSARHDSNLSPHIQYPMGGGFLQWTLKKPGLKFYFAASVDDKGEVSTPRGSFSLNSGNFAVDYPQRARFQKYLQQA